MFYLGISRTDRTKIHKIKRAGICRPAPVAYGATHGR
nr:MAG TPA: hypothetical protein [Caudoviricetes sp.]